MEFFSGLDTVKFPLNLKALAIGRLIPGQHFIAQAWKICQPSLAQALACQQADFDFSLIDERD